MPTEQDQLSDSTKDCGAGAGGGGGGAWRVGVAGRARAGRAAAAECAAAALLVLLTCCTAPPDRPLASGLIVTLLVQCFDGISGAYLNPAVTLAGVVWGREGWARGAVLAGAQLAGAALGAALLHALLPALACSAPACLTLPDTRLHVFQAVLVEGVGGGCLALANCAAWDARASGGDSWPLRIGVAVTALSLALGGLTGASMNPARSFGPALLANDWRHHWVYWVGPLLGAGAASLAYVRLWRVLPPRAPRAPRAPSPAPLV